MIRSPLARRRRAQTSRQLRLEFLEARRLLAADAVDDAFVYLIHERLEPQVLPVRANDTGEEIRVSAVGEPDQGGRVEIGGRGRAVAYKPAAGFEGVEKFPYEIVDDEGNSDRADVQVTVTRPAVLRGSKWLDRNGDGERQDGEPGLFGWLIYTDQNENGRLDEGERFTRTAPDGRFQLLVPPGEQVVAEAQRDGWLQTAPRDGVYRVDVNAGDVADGLHFGNQPQFGTVTGVKFHDLNGDGERQDNEPGLRGWVIFSDLNENGELDEGERAVRTDHHGRYQLLLPAGNHTIAELQREGWRQTAPEDGFHAVDLAAGERREGLDFGNQSQRAVLKGVAWHDRNGDGERQDGEPGLPGVTIYLDANENGRRDEGERATRSGLHGEYHFLVGVGVHVVAAQQREGWLQTAPDSGSYEVEVAPGEVVDDLHFGFRQSAALIRGLKWHDRNGDGERQEGEPGVPGWLIFLDANENGELDEGERATRTGPRGHYVFRVEPGEYRVAEGQVAGWRQTAPADGSHDVTVEAGQIVEGVDFGNQRLLGSLHGLKWADRNGDGQRQEGEPGIPGWEIYLDQNGNGQWDDDEAGTVTGPHGRYHFVLPPGEYTVAEVRRDNWTQTAPEGGVHQVALEAGQEIAGLDFGNQPNWGAIHGVVWFDRNGDGEFNRDRERGRREFGLPGWVVYLDANNNGELDDGERATRSRRHGRYRFDELEPGDYVVRQLVRPRWEQTFPEGGFHKLTVESGELVADADFGVRLAPRNDSSLMRVSLMATDSAGRPLQTIMEGMRFFLDAYVEDLREPPQGIREAALDVLFDDELFERDGDVEVGATFHSGRPGVEDTEGFLDEFGGAEGRAAAAEGGLRRLVRVPLKALGAGQTAFDAAPADLLPALIGAAEPLPVERVEFAGSQLDVVRNPHVNRANRLDVNNDLQVTPLDVLLLINDINLNQPRQLPLAAGLAPAFVDVNMDGHLTPGDALHVINFLNGAAEGETTAASALAASDEWLDEEWLDEEWLDEEWLGCLGRDRS